jgi:hypothetical protein
MCQSLRLRDWQRVQDLVRQWEADGKLSEKPAPLTVKEACDKFIADVERGICDSLLFTNIDSYSVSCRTSSANRLPFIMDLDIHWARRFPLFLEKQKYCRAQEARSVPRVLPVRA